MKRIAFVLMLATTAIAQETTLFTEMRWRMIGPFRGGRTVAAVGVPSQRGVFYIGVNNGGVWKTTDYGRVWFPIFDDQPSGSIGAIAVAPSDPNVLYVGSGEGLQRPDLATGNGMYKSTDAGATWQYLGLRDAQQIPMIAVDPRDPNRLFVAVLGHPYGPNAERGIYRSTDGGRTFEKVLYRDENTGGIDVVIDPSNPQVVYSALWEARQGPWENGVFRGLNSGVFKSTDGGTTWTQLKSGLPEPLSRVGLEVCRANPRRLYANVSAKNGGIFRSDDAGATWTRVSDDERLWGRDGDFNEIRSDPKNADVVYIANVVTWKSSDGGRTWAALRGAPGGDDYHRLWIDPNDPRVILNAADQGAIITVNGGESWSSWYNQPTAQFYHVSTDNAFPYRVCGGQQESGSACVNSRSDDGAIGYRDWHPVGAEEYGYAVPDPLNPEIVYGGKISRYDRRTGQVVDITPRPLRQGNYRVLRTQPIVFSQADPHVLFFASNTVWRTTNGGNSWTEISADLTRPTWTVPPNVGKFTADVKVTQRGVVYALAPSPLDINRLWAGTDDGLIHVTSDGGKTWTNVTPPQLTPWAKVSIMEASHFDALEAYAAINTFRLDDLRPHILRTRDGGKTWTDVAAGIRSEGIINVVREDPKKRGLLFAGSENEVFVSFDDGDHWQSLRLNMPATSIRDLVLHEDDVVVGTHGRGFWILDDIEPLRQASSIAGAAVLMKPQRAWRYRWNKWTDTPLPPDEPAGQNPPDGAIIDYWVGRPGIVKLDILDSAGNVVRHFETTGAIAGETRRIVKPFSFAVSPTVTTSGPRPNDQGNVPWYWIRPPQVLSGDAGLHRFVWDLKYEPIAEDKPSYPISAIPYDTAPSLSTIWAQPGNYTVRLTANGVTTTQPLVVQMDPRVTTSGEGLAQQFTLSKQVYDVLARVQTALNDSNAMRSRLQDAAKSTAADVSKQSAKAGESVLDRALALRGEEVDGFARPADSTQKETLNTIAAQLRSVLDLLQGADVAPSTQAVAIANDRVNAATDVLKRWEELRRSLSR